MVLGRCLALGRFTMLKTPFFRIIQTRLSCSGLRDSTGAMRNFDTRLGCLSAVPCMISLSHLLVSEIYVSRALMI